MKTFSTRVTIDAPPETVWAILTDLSGWPRWNTTISRVEGEVTPGAKVTVYTAAMPDRAFPVKVDTLSAPREMVWVGGMPLGMFTGTRTYRLEPVDGGKTSFEMTEVYTGLMAPVIGKSMPDLQASFDEFASCLKREAEGRR